MKTINRWFRAMYDWVLHWAETPYGAPALFLLAFAESSFFPIPPDVLLIALAIGLPKRSFRYALICSIASVIGGLAGYLIGSFLWYRPGGAEFSALANLFFTYVPGFTEPAFHHVQELYRQYDFWIVFAAGFTPIPYKLITITAGVFDISLPVFLFASVISRSARFFLVAGLIWRFGPAIKRWIDRYFNILSWAFLALLIGGFAVIKYAL